MNQLGDCVLLLLLYFNKISLKKYGFVKNERNATHVHSAHGHVSNDERLNFFLSKR
jgi:hypothetical protein